MFAGKHRPGAADSLRAAADRAFEAPLALITEAPGRRRGRARRAGAVATVAFAALHGLASLVNAGMLDAAALDDTVAAAVHRLMLGLRPR